MLHHPQRSLRDIQFAEPANDNGRSERRRIAVAFSLAIAVFAVLLLSVGSL